MLTYSAKGPTVLSGASDDTLKCWGKFWKEAADLGAISLYAGEVRAWATFEGHQRGKLLEEAVTQNGLGERMPALAEDRPGDRLWLFHFLHT